MVLTRSKRQNYVLAYPLSQKTGTCLRWTSMTTTMPQNPPYKRGDVILVLFPNSDLRTAKIRPALIVQADQLQTGLSQIIVAMISSQMARAGHPSRVTVL